MFSEAVPLQPESRGGTCIKAAATLQEIPFFLPPWRGAQAIPPLSSDACRWRLQGRSLSSFCISLCAIFLLFLSLPSALHIITLQTVFCEPGCPFRFRLSPTLAHQPLLPFIRLALENLPLSRSLSLKSQDPLHWERSKSALRDRSLSKQAVLW